MSEIDAFLHEARRAYVASNRGTLEWMLDRPPLNGAFLNSKMNSITLADYGDADGWRGPRVLYGWIQGRGLEALVSHAEFFEHEDPALAVRLDGAGRRLYAALKELYDRHGGAFFTYDDSLVPVVPGPHGKAVRQFVGTPYRTYSDAFVLKGLIAASTRYDLASRPAYLREMADLVAAIEGGRFIMDEQQPLAAEVAAAQHAEFGPRMIVLGAASLLRRLGLEQEARFGDRFIGHVLTRHWDAVGQNPSLLIRDAEGGDRCNVGHAIEFAGFAYEYLPADADPAIVEAVRKALVASFDKGFAEPGLCLAVSAATGELLSPNFPWWSLPETTRAAAFCYARTKDPAALRVWRKAHKAFFANYWRENPAIAYQTRDRDGPVDFVPATPDLDPGYHTGLSFLGAIEAIDKLLGQAR
jgi:hypothetical protein